MAGMPVSDDACDRLVAARDPIDAARHMELLAGQPERWPEMGKASLEMAQVHGLDNTVQQYEKLYEKVLSGAPLEGIS